MTSRDHVNSISICKNPYPYKAMLAICSDLDETRSAEIYFNTSMYLNSTGQTPFGKGVGLEVGNTMYFDMAPGEFCYWNATSSEQGHIRELIRAGLIDCFHSFGDTASERAQAGRVLDHLDQHRCRIKVWVDHAVAPSNFGRDIMQGLGDVVGSSAYHADLTLAYGVRYVWMGRVSSMLGQDAPTSIAGLVERADLFNSTATACKELAKIISGALGNTKYRMHFGNNLIRNVELRDNQNSVEFLRSNPNPHGVSHGATADGLSKALRSNVLDRLVTRQSRSIIYTHLGKEIDSKKGFSAKSRQAIESLADLYSKGEILVTTTRRLLDYSSLIRSIKWTTTTKDRDICIDLQGVDLDFPLDGLSFKVPMGRDIRIMRGAEVVETTRLPNVETGAAVITVPWRKLGSE